MFKKYSISLEYFEDHIDIFILKYTGIRYENINFIMKMNIHNKYYSTNDKYYKYIKEYHIEQLIKNNIKIKSVFEYYNKDQKNLENFTERNIKD